MNSRLVLALAAIMVVVVVLILGMIMINSGPGSSAPGPTQLAGVEVRSFNGSDLSSLRDFHENSIKGPQYVNETDYRLTVSGLTGKTLVMSYRDVLDMYPHYTKVVTLHCVEGWDVKILWEGVLVRDIVQAAGSDSRANTVIFTARDGYTTSLPLDYIVKNDILLAYKMNNVTLPAERGFPFELVAEDKWGYKWIKWVEKIELSDDPGYKGYWEQRGYSNTGDLEKGFFS
jgi:DMSO/TMAO reductase YedYZ molybdopterin-dependent catalytic subunit